jgi:hypothetical protein
LFRILLIYSDYGRLGNRLHTHANSLAWCIANNYNLINLSFNDYAVLFESSPKHNSGNLHQNENFIFKSLSSRLFRNLLRRLLLSDKWVERLAWIIKQIRPTHNNMLDEADLSREINQKKINLIKHWDIRCTNSLKLHQNEVRDYLWPKKKFVASADKIINKLRSEYDCIVGIHARRGDYATYLDGLHYHSWESYSHWANQTKKVLENLGKKNVGIVICTDEESPAHITEVQSVFISTSKEIMVDIHLLSLCDYNLGPPSSFGTWVSWFGEVPRITLQKGLIIQSLNQFQISDKC